MTDNNENGSASVSSGQSENNNSVSISVSDYVVLPSLSLTIILALAYSILIIIRPTFRANKLNWFTINVCITTILLSCVMMTSSIMKFMNTSSLLSCRAQSFLTVMAACQMMYSHSVVAFSRFLAIVYSNKRIFRSIACIWIFIIIGWLIAFLIALPFWILNGYACSSSSQSSFLPYYALVGVLVIPIMIVMICNIRIFLFVRRSSRRVHAEGRGNNISQARDVYLIKIMIVTFTVFVIGWIPLFVEQIFSSNITLSSAVDNIFQILPLFSMLFDVILLIYTNQPVRLFLCQLIKHRRQINPTANKVNTIGEH